MKENFSNVCTLIMGQSPDSSTYNTQSIGLPFYQGNADFGKINPSPRVWCSSPKKVAEIDDILISVRAPIGDLNIANEKCGIGRGLAAIRIKDRNQCDLIYLFHFLESKTKYLQEKGTGSTFKAINKDSLLGLDIPLPSIETQKNISNALIDLHRLIDCKKAQLLSLDELVKSRFIEMFESTDFPIKTISEVCVLRSGITFDKSLELEQGEILYCKVSDMNLVGNSKYMTVSKTYVTKAVGKKSAIPANSVIFPKRGGAIGTNKKRITLNDTCVDLNTMAVTPTMQLDIQYLYQYFQNIDLGTLCDGSTIPQLNNKNIGPLKIKIPPIELQNKFAEFVKLIDKSKFIVQQQIKDLQELLDSKMDEYFR